MTRPVSYYDKFKFVVESDALGGQAFFMTCSEIAAEAEVVTYAQGVTDHKSPGRVTFPPVTLTQGATRGTEMLDWFKRTFNAATGVGGVPPALYTTLDIVQLDYAGNAVQRWTLYNAWCSRFSSGDWDSSTSEKRIREVTIEYERFELFEQ
jgi:phage tail-like protein